jgi:hypothetical protein
MTFQTGQLSPVPKVKNIFDSVMQWCQQPPPQFIPYLGGKSTQFVVYSSHKVHYGAHSENISGNEINKHKTNVIITWFEEHGLQPRASVIKKTYDNTTSFTRQYAPIG